MPRYAMVIDRQRCVGCGACSIACRNENNVTEGVYWSHKITETSGVFPNVRFHYIPTLCNHCTHAPCVRGCPTRAMYKIDNGITIAVIAVGTSTTLGWLMGMTDARPALNASFFSVYFPLTGFGSGIAVLLLFSIVYERLAGRAVPEKAADLYNELARIMGIIAGVVLILFLWRSVIGGISSTSEEMRAFRHMIGSIPYHIELWLGLAIPTLMMLVPSIRQTFSGKVTASFLVLAGMFAGRLEFVLSGVIRPLGQMAEGRPEFVSYTPNFYEIFVALAGFSVMLLIYTLGDRYLKLQAAPEH